MKEKLNKILNSIYRGMGEWAGVGITYCPEWVEPLKEAAEMVEEAFADFDIVKENVRKEIEGKFIDGAIKHAERCADSEPFEVGRRKHRGKMYQVFITVKEVKDEMPKMMCPKCGALQDDFDGLSFSYCPVCGYCSHPNSTREGEKEICGICGQEIKRGCNNAR